MKFPRFIDIMFLVMSVAFIFTLGELRLSKEQIEDKDYIINQYKKEFNKIDSITTLSSIGLDKIDLKLDTISFLFDNINTENTILKKENKKLKKEIKKLNICIIDTYPIIK